VGAESSANCGAQTAGARTQETYMYDITHLEKLSAFGKAGPEAMASFQAFDKAASTPVPPNKSWRRLPSSFVAAALRAGVRWPTALTWSTESESRCRFHLKRRRGFFRQLARDVGAATPSLTSSNARRAKSINCPAGNANNRDLVDHV
jgi:hypothetical protein